VFSSLYKVIVVVDEERGDEAPFEVVGIGMGFAASQACALQQNVAEIGHRTGLFGGDGAVGEGERKLFEETLDFFGRNEGAGSSFEFAGKIGGPKAAMRGVGVGVAEAVAVGMGRLSAAASIGESEVAEGKTRRVKALAGHFAKV